MPVTALTAEAASFSARLRGLTRAQPGPGSNVDRTVEVSVHCAAVAADYGVLLRALTSAPAPVAADARAGRIHEHDSPASLFRFAG